MLIDQVPNEAEIIKEIGTDVCIVIAVNLQIDLWNHLLS